MKVKKIIIISIIMLLVAGNAVLADDVTNVYGNNITADTGMSNIASTLLSIVRAGAVAMGSVAAVVLGIRYVYSAPDQKAEVKKKLIPFIIGACLAFGAASLVNLVYAFAKGL